MRNYKSINFLILLLSFCAIKSTAQSLSVQLNEDKYLVIKNTDEVTLKIEILPKGESSPTTYLEPGGSMVHEYKVRRKEDADKVRIYTFYDIKCYQKDVAKIKGKFKERAIHREDMSKIEPQLVLLDQLLKSQFSKGATNLDKFKSLKISGASPEEWLKQIPAKMAKNTSAGYSRNKARNKGLIQFIFQMAALVQKGEHTDLRMLNEKYINTFSSSKMTSIQKASDFDLIYPSKKGYPNLSLELGAIAFSNIKRFSNDEVFWKAGSNLGFSGFEKVPYQLGAIWHGKVIGFKAGIGQSALMPVKNEDTNRAGHAKWISGGVFVQVLNEPAPNYGVDLGVFYKRANYKEYTETSTVDGMEWIEDESAATPLNLAGFDIGLFWHTKKAAKFRLGGAFFISPTSEINDEKPDWKGFAISTSLIVPFYQLKW